MHSLKCPKYFWGDCRPAWSVIVQYGKQKVHYLEYYLDLKQALKLILITICGHVCCLHLRRIPWFINIKTTSCQPGGPFTYIILTYKKKDLEVWFHMLDKCKCNEPFINVSTQWHIFVCCFWIRGTFDTIHLLFFFFNQRNVWE